MFVFLLLLFLKQMHKRFTHLNINYLFIRCSIDNNSEQSIKIPVHLTLLTEQLARCSQILRSKIHVIGLWDYNH